MAFFSSRSRSCGCRQTGAAGPLAAPHPRQLATGWKRRGAEIAGWLIPGTLLAFLPKCPLCVAGYVTLATGLGVSLTAATYLRLGLLAACFASLALMTGRRWRRRIKSPEQACSGLIV